MSLQTGIPPTQVAAEIPADMTALQSDYFSLQMFIEIGSARLLAERLLQRSGGDVGVVRRELHWVPALAPEIAGPDVCGLEEG